MKWKNNYFSKICVLLFILATNHFSFSQNADINLLKKINVERNQSLDPTFKTITNSVTPISIGAPIVTFTVGLIQKDSTLKNKGIYLAETFVVNGFFTIALKYSVQRDRPFVTYPFIDKQAEAGSLSFPSGHTSAAFATATSLSLSFRKWYVVAPAFIWAGSVGYSRMHLGVHYPSDVLAGAFVGAGSAFLSYKLNQWINKKNCALFKIKIPD